MNPIRFFVSRQRAVAPRSNFICRWLAPVALVALAVSTVLLGIHAKDLVLNSRDGAIARNITDPAAPGFSAQVIPTPTFLVVQTNDKNELVGVTLMSLASTDGGGGTLLFFPSDVIITLATGDSATLAGIYASAGNDGATVVRRALSRMIEADIDGSINLGADALAKLIQPVAPLQYTLRDAVRTVQNGVTVTLLKSGPVAVTTTEQVRAATEVLGPGEASVNRTARQQAFWTAWVGVLHAAGDTSQLLLNFDTGITHFLRILAKGNVSYQQASFTEQTYKGASLLVADKAAILATTREMIPSPQAYEPGARVAVELRNGVHDPSLNDAASRKIVDAGGQVILLGNAPQFGVTTSSVVYYDAANKDRIEAFAHAIHLPIPQFLDRPGSSIEATVTIGADFTR